MSLKGKNLSFDFQSLMEEHQMNMESGTGSSKRSLAYSNQLPDNALITVTVD